jgi:hypothetical protein
VFVVGDNVNLIMRRLTVLFALCSNRAAFQDSVLVKWHLSPSVEAERLSILLFVKAQAMEQHSTPVRRLWQYSKLNVSSTRGPAGEPQCSQFFIPVLAWTATVAEVLVHLSVGDILVGL